MGKNTKRALVIFAVLLLAADVIGSLAAIHHYKQVTLSREALFDLERSSFVDFETDDEKRFTSLSDDPWIYYILEEPVHVWTVRAKISDVSGPDTMAQFYLFPDIYFKQTPLREGTVKVRFDDVGRNEMITAVRLDLASDKDVSFFVDEAVINSRFDIILAFQSFFLFILVIAGAAVLEVLCWRRLLRSDAYRERNKYPCIILIAVQAVAKAALFILLLSLLRTASADEQILAYIIFASLEIFCLTAVFSASQGKHVHIGLSYLLLVPYSFLQFGLIEILCINPFSFDSVPYLLLNVAALAIIPALILIISRRTAIAFSVSAAAFAILGIANHYYGIFRDNPLEYFDIALAGTAAGVVENYTFTLDRQVIIAVLVLISLIAALSASFGLRRLTYSKNSLFAGLGCVVAAAIILTVNIPVIYNFSNLQIISSDQGYILSFLSLMKSGRVSRPDGYSYETADSILASHDTLTKEDEPGGPYPDIIVIMNEAFADLPNLFHFETNEDVIPNIHSMNENTVRGALLVSVYGGGTSNTEYEFLTGNSLYFFPIESSPYVQFLSDEQQSFARKLENLDYSVIGYHPYLAMSYRRNVVYPLLGLDNFFTSENPLPYEGNIRNFVSDRADYENIIYLYENRDQSRPFFVFNVTMQNHGGYASGDYDLDISIYPTDERLQDEKMLEYLYLIHESDTAFAELVDYFSNVENDTIILMFGDHQPSMGRDLIDIMESCTEEYEASYDGQRIWFSSFVMWANFDIEERTGVLTSPNYLRAILSETAGIRLNAYEHFLLTLSETYPAINSYGYYDTDGNWNPRSTENNEILTEYNYLIYNNVFDKKNMIPSYFE